MVEGRPRKSTSPLFASDHDLPQLQNATWRFPGAAPGEWASMSTILWLISLGLAAGGFAIPVWQLFCFAGVVAFGAAYATLATINTRALASRFYDSRCPNVGQEYEVGFWTFNG